MRSLTLRMQRKATVDDRSGTSLLTQGIRAAYTAEKHDRFRAARLFRATYPAVKVPSFKSPPSLDPGDRKDRSS